MENNKYRGRGVLSFFLSIYLPLFLSVFFSSFFSYLCDFDEAVRHLHTRRERRVGQTPAASTHHSITTPIEKQKKKKKERVKRKKERERKSEEKERVKRKKERESEKDLVRSEAELRVREMAG